MASLIRQTGKWAPHVSGLLEKGFRVIAPDLPSVSRVLQCMLCQVENNFHLPSMGAPQDYTPT